MQTRPAPGTFSTITLTCALTLACQREPALPDRQSSGVDTSRAGPAPVAATRPSRGVSGTVSFSGVGVTGAEVCASWRSAQVLATREDVVPRCTKTDAAGRYALELPVGAWLLVASAWGYLPDGEELVVREKESSMSLDFFLRQGGSARAGTIIDLEGAPVAGIHVAAQMPLSGRVGYATRVQTNAQGHFELWADDDATLVVDSPGYIDMVFYEADTYTALSESVIEGRVIDQAGKPVAEARVTYVGLGDPPLGVPEHATLTDAEGRFRLGNVSPDKYDLMAFRDNLGGTKKVSVEFAQTRTDVEIVMTLSLEWLHAQVVETSGEPVASCLVGLKPASDPRAWAYTFWTDEEGRLATPTLPDARFNVDFLQCPRMVGKPPYDPLVSGRPEGESSRLEVALGHVLRGRILDAGKQPLVDVKVSIDTPERDLPTAADARDSRSSFMTFRRSARTDAEGRFEIAGLFPGEFEIQVEGRHRTGPPLRVFVTDQPMTEASFTMEESARLELRSSEMRSYQLVWLVDCSAERDPGVPQWTVQEATDERGMVILEYAPVGTLAAAIEHRPSCDDAESLLVTTHAGQTTEVQLRAPAPPPKTVVHVVDPTGKNVARAVVTIVAVDIRPTSTRWWHLGEFGITDAHGQASFERGCDRSNPCTAVSARPGMFGTTTVEPGHSGEIVIALQPTGP